MYMSTSVQADVNITAVADHPPLKGAHVVRLLTVAAWYRPSDTTNTYLTVEIQK